MRLTDDRKKRIDSYFENISDEDFLAKITNEYNFKFEPYEELGFNFELCRESNYEESKVDYDPFIVIMNTSIEVSSRKKSTSPIVEVDSPTTSYALIA